MKWDGEAWRAVNLEPASKEAGTVSCQLLRNGYPGGDCITLALLEGLLLEANRGAVDCVTERPAVVIPAHGSPPPPDPYSDAVLGAMFRAEDTAILGGEPAYRRVIADLRSIGYGPLALELEFEANMLYGDPGAPTLFGLPILVDPTMPEDAIDLVGADGTRTRLTNVATVPPLPEDPGGSEPFLPPAYPVDAAGSTAGVFVPMNMPPAAAEWLEERKKVLAKIQRGDFDP